MTNHNSSPEFYSIAEAIDAYANETFGLGWEDLATDPESRRMVNYNDVKDPREDVVRVPDFRLVPGAYA